ncbi:MAG: fructose-6-phosphate aldolase [Alphaproteobacteria bacterium]|nr:fructose-6-phosphate aldolase [Alphaproteobacteria bacterium]
MQIFLDSADIGEVEKWYQTGLIDGVTTNPSLIAKSGRDILETIKEICAIVKGSVSAEVTALDCPTMLKEADRFLSLADNVTIKVPLTPDGLLACKTLSDKGVSVNVTLCFSAAQALLAAKAGAEYISPFVGRLDDIGYDGLTLIGEIVEIFENYEFSTNVLAASVRNPLHVVECAKIGADVATLPPKTLEMLYQHPLTDKGLKSFMDDWQKTGQSIL